MLDICGTTANTYATSLALAFAESRVDIVFAEVWGELKSLTMCCKRKVIKRYESAIQRGYEVVSVLSEKLPCLKTSNGCKSVATSSWLSLIGRLAA